MKHIPVTDFVQARPDISTRGFIRWLNAQDPDATYPYCAPSKCAIGQWVHTIDPAFTMGSDSGFEYIIHGESHNLLHLMHIVRGDSTRQTFGQAQARAKVKL